MPRCFVNNCNSRWRNKDSDVSMHTFPRNVEQIQKWLFQLNNDALWVEELSLRIKSCTTGAYRICARHFTKDSYEQRGSLMFLRRDAVPTLSLNEEELPEHAYVKRRKTESRSVKNVTAVPGPEEGVHTPFVPCTPNGEEDMSPSQLYLFPGQLTVGPLFPLIDVQVMEEAETSSNVPICGQGASAQAVWTQVKKKKVPLADTVGTSTEYFPGRVHKQTQFDEGTGAKHRNIQVFRRPPHKSIAIQCNLADLPHLFKGGDLDIERAGATSIVSEEDEESETLAENSNGQQEMLDSYDSTEEEEGGEEEEHLRGTIVNEERCIDPTDSHKSYVFIPERTGPVSHVEENKFIVFESCLDKLLMSCRCLATTTCPGTIIKIQKFHIGSAVSVMALCSLKHRYHLWSSQPIIGRMPVGNLLISAGVMCSGSNFAKMESFFRTIGLLGISQEAHHINQATYLYPTIDHHWQVERSQTIQKVLHRPVAVAGDGQLHSSRLKGKYCTYSFHEQGTKKIIDFQIEQSEPGNSTADLEKRAFQITLDRLLLEGVNIRVVCTDRRVALRQLLKCHYSRIKHEFDAWHVAQFVGNRLAFASHMEKCAQIANWISPAKKHLWWAASTCSHNPTLLREKWASLIYHVANRHQWQNASLYKKCSHGKLSKEEESVREWLEPGSAAHSKLKEVVTNNKLMKDLNHLSHVCHGGELEVFRNIALKYCSQRSHHCLDEMTACAQLAALEYNHNIKRMQAVVTQLTPYESEGETLRHGDKSKMDWVEKCYEPTNQAFVTHILADILDVASGIRTFPWNSRREEVPRSIMSILSGSVR